MADDYTIAMVGAQDYWIENVGGEVYVCGHPSHHHRPRRDFSYADSPLFYTITIDDNGRPVRTYDDDTDDRKGDNVAGIFGDIVHAVTHPGDIVHAVNKAASKVGHAINKIPVLGTVIHATLKLDPIMVIGGLASRVAHGERLDKAFLATGKEQLKAVRDIAPYVKTVVSFVPGVGTGVAAAIAAGTAIAEGRTITDAVKESVLAAVPGGDLAQMAARAAAKIADGGSLTTATLDAVKSQLPSGALEAVDVLQRVAKGQNVAVATVNALKTRLPAEAQHGIDLALEAAKGGNLKTAVLHAVRANLPPAAQKGLDIGTAIAAAANIQSNTVKALAKPAAQAPLAAMGAKLLAASPTLARHAPTAPEPKKGFTIAAGALGHSAVNAHSLLALRNALPKAQQPGFDHAVQTFNNTHNPQWTSMVTHGRVLRGDWRPSHKDAPNSVYGRAVAGGKVTHGWFARV